MGLPARVLRAIPSTTLAGRFALLFLLLAFWFALSLGNGPVFFAICCLVATVLLSAAATSLAVPGLALRRDLPERVVAGEPFSVRLTVRNLSRWRAGYQLAFRDALQASDAGEVTCTPIVPVLPPGAAVEISYEARVHRRGHHRVTNFLVATRFPFGLFERRGMLQDSALLIVLPALGELGREARRELAHAARAPMLRRSTRPGSGEFHAMREFRPGDNPRHIHWRTSARAMTLVRREFREESGRDLVVLLDTYTGGLHAEQRRRQFEKAVSCAATLAAQAARDGRPMTLLFPGEEPVRVRGPGRLSAALEALARIEGGSRPPEAWVGQVAAGPGASTLLLSLAGEAEAARRAAAARGLRLTVWDVSHPGFAKVFVKR